MRSSTISVLLGAASMATAIQITSPSKNDVVDLSSGVQVKWTTVNTDPSTAHLFLVNMASGHTPYSKDLGEVDLSKGSLLVSEDDAPEGGALQFNFQSVKQNNMGILAQSEQFENKKEDDKDDDELVIDSTTKAATSTGGAKTTMTTATTAATAATTTGADADENDADEADETSTTTTGTASGAATSSTGTPESAAAGLAVKGSMLALVAGVLAVVA
ncbi:hypothetical protein B0T21DRAFT_366897 [Apiosordaria backusii]|uniref:Yeast cell wall synthesis Kre9/Knh1-like N-terminal domain-containing protein n=1 Tax=Apiosordaria backusii TaxID=314023 RepID=A0AA40EDZ1_9PEZI|nr:hypothetical protein B0T21DRAFT_366897 [Apiosordaria backusii]